MKSQNNSVIAILVGLFSFFTGSALMIGVGLAVIALKVAIICAVIYFFFAAGGFVPPLDFVPLIPYI